MANLENQKPAFDFHLDPNKMSSIQYRLVKSVLALITHTMEATNEEEFFESSSELLKKTANLIAESKFPQGHKHATIPYGKQAVEYSLEVLNEFLEQQSLKNFDN